MKKKLFLLLATTTSLGASAQTMLNLSGSSYYQSFDKIGSGLPKGWEVDSLASSTSKGFAMNFDTNPNAWSNATGKSKNVAAKDTLSSTASTTLQNAARNRALGVRQTTPIDIGVAFTLTISQTQSLSNLNIAFNLQSLDANSKRTTIWQVQYGIGATPSTFTTVSASSTNGLTTGNSTFSNSVVTASFGSALDSQLGPVVIRVVTLNGTVGTNSRATSAIDSFALSWTGTPVVYEPQLISFTPTNNATGVPTATTLVLNFDKNITAGTGKVYLRNMTDKTSISKLTTSSDVTISGTQASVTNLGLALGKAYSVTFDTNAFMSGAFASFGIMDSTAWVFSTINPTITVNSINENFDLACASNKLPTGWNRQNVQGSGQEWSCYMELGGSNAAMQMNGYMGGNNVNEDWLITPRVTLGGIGSTEGKITFRMQKNFSGTEPDVLISNDYDGTSAPNTATWASLNIPMSIADTGDYKTFSAPIGLTGSLAFFIAFRYASTSTDGYRVRLDSVVLDVTTGVGNVTSKNNKMPLQILKAQKGNIQIAFSANTSGKMHASISDMVGRQIFDANIQAIQGENSFTFSTQDFPSGMYLIKVGSSQEQGVARAFIQ